MSDPYAILGLAAGASQDDIRQQYLALVRRHPPERDPQRFSEIRAAYEALNDRVTNLQQRILELQTNDSMEAIFDAVQARLRSRRIPTDILLSLGK